MNSFDNVVCNIIILIFPVLCYLFYVVIDKGIKDNTKRLIFRFTLLSMFYLIYKYSTNVYLKYLLFTIPIFISLRKNYTDVFISLIIIGIVIIYDVDVKYIAVFLLENILIFIFNKNRKVILNIIIISIINISYYLIFDIYNINTNFLSLLQYIVLQLLVYYTIDNCESMVNYNIEYNKLKRENELRRSLFKITHEIKNPLAVCKAYVDIFDYDDIECAKKYIPIISGEIDKMLLLLQDFLLVNKDNINFDIMDINVLLESINKTMLEIHHMKIDLDASEDEIFINGDYNRLTQVLTNLIKNSYEAHATKVMVKSYIENNKIVIDVIDDGDGIMKKDSKKIFEPFYTTKIDGTGLGVPLCKEIIEAHNGTLNYYDNDNKGTIAKVVLPLLDI